MEAQEIKAVFFDAGNTLFRETPLRWEIYARAGREAGLAIETEAMRRAMHRAHEELPQRIDGHFRYSDRWFQEYIPRVFAKFGAKPEQIPKITETLFAAFRTPGTFQIFPETVETLDALRERKIKMGVISNWSPRLPTVCEKLGLAPYFDFIFSSSIEEAEKPSPEIFLRALAKTGAGPREAIHIGDSFEKDVQGAAGAGILGILIDRDGRHEAPPGTPRIRSLREVIPLVEKGIEK